MDTPSINIYPVADVQLGGAGVDVTAFREFVRDIVNDPVGHIIGVGDYTDSISPSNRKLLSAAFVKGELYDTVREMVDGAAIQYAEEFIELVAPTVGQWDAVLKGHHLHEYVEREANGLHTLRTTDHDIADAMGAPYLGEPGTTINVAMITYRFPKVGKRRPVLRVLAMHGQGGSSTWSGPLNQLEKMMRAFNADIYLVAHHHKLVAARAVKLNEDPKAPTKLQATDSVLVAAGSWMRGYMLNETTYAEDGLMVPLATGAPIIHVASRDNGTFRIRVEV